nr:uncharacterized protein LOC108012258 [Drosophila suzukii]
MHLLGQQQGEITTTSGAPKRQTAVGKVVPVLFFLEPQAPENRTEDPKNWRTLWNHKGNMLHMHSPKAICIQMLPTHFKNCTITGVFFLGGGEVVQRKRVKAAS